MFKHHRTHQERENNVVLCTHYSLRACVNRCQTCFERTIYTLYRACFKKGRWRAKTLKDVQNTIYTAAVSA